MKLGPGYYLVQTDDRFFVCRGSRVIDGGYTEVVSTPSGVMLLYPDPDRFEWLPKEQFQLTPPDDIDLASVASVLSAEGYEHVQHYALV
jgi:hypothetical protein